INPYLPPRPCVVAAAPSASPSSRTADKTSPSSATSWTGEEDDPPHDGKTPHASRCRHPRLGAGGGGARGDDDFVAAFVRRGREGSAKLHPELREDASAIDARSSSSSSSLVARYRSLELGGRCNTRFSEGFGGKGTTSIPVWDSQDRPSVRSEKTELATLCALLVAVVAVSESSSSSWPLHSSSSSSSYSSSSSVSYSSSSSHPSPPSALTTLTLGAAYSLSPPGLSTTATPAMTAGRFPSQATSWG
ncbi:hypothetical protein ACHAWF_010607, partial [Thalassiosira exigua]